MQQKEMNRNVIYQKRPANLTHERWKDATPLGNGETGALVFGDVGMERIRFTRADIWEGIPNSSPPDVCSTLTEVRNAMDKGAFIEANTILAEALSEKGYAPGLSAQFPIGDLSLEFTYADDCFTCYRRILHLDTAHCEIIFKIGDNTVTRSSFISREDGLFYMNIRTNMPITVRAELSLPCVDSRRDASCNLVTEENRIIYTRKDGQEGCGLICKIAQTDGKVTNHKQYSTICDFTQLTLTVKSLSNQTETGDFTVSDYHTAFLQNVRKYSELFDRTDIVLSEENNPASDKSNEELLLDVFDGTPATNDSTLILYEKLWRFGRYLFISGIRDYPFPLYGLWTGDYQLPWAQHVANENVQIIHWNALAGNLPELLKPLIRYFYEKIPQFKENARALFGCKGILVSVYTTPHDSHIAPPVPVILNFTMASGWLCHNFFDYYDLTQDDETLINEILPFAYETAAFIEDFAVIRDGVLSWYPSVSPENTPGSFVNHSNPMAHSMPTTKNATIELAIVKETLTRLSDIAKKKAVYFDKIPVWQKIIDSVPTYKINADGAVKEWQSDEFDDFYCHRHLSHLYPVFPGNEINRNTNPTLWKAFERAVDLRELGGQSGWSFAHMAGIYARLGRGEDMLDCIDYLCRACLYDNFFTVHNDWRENHLTLRMENPPIQLDALMGIVNVIQQMLVDDDGKVLHLFNALPAKMRKGYARGLAFRYGTVSLAWDRDTKQYSATIYATRSGVVTVETPVVSRHGEYRSEEMTLICGEQYQIIL